jgi:hypothetical protein
VVPTKAERVHNFHKNTLEAFKEILEATGLHSPSDLDLHHILRRVSESETKTLSSLFPSLKAGSLSLTDSEKNGPDEKGSNDAQAHPMPAVFSTYWPLSRPNSFALSSRG